MVHFLQEITRSHFPLGGDILGDDAVEMIRKYADGTSEKEWLKSYSTVVHEGYHHWEGQNRSTWASTRYLVARGLEIEVPHRELYDTRDLHPTVVDSLKEKIFRYRPYIFDGDRRLGSHVYGIYGLMEEWNAYLLGVKASLSLESWYRDRLKGNTGKEAYELMGAGFLTNPASSMLAHHEFRLFIAWYLEYAQVQRPEVYEACMKNKLLRVAFTLIDQEFDAVESHWLRMVDDFIAESSAWDEGRVVLREGFLSYVTDRGGYGNGLFLDDRAFLRELLQSEGHDQILARFRLPGVNKANWQDHLH